MHLCPFRQVQIEQDRHLGFFFYGLDSQSQRDDEYSFPPLAISMQSKIELPPTRDGKNSFSSRVIVSASKSGQTGFRRDLEEGIRLGSIVLSNSLSSDDVPLILGVLLSYRFRFAEDIQHLGASVKFLNEFCYRDLHKSVAV